MRCIVCGDPQTDRCHIKSKGSGGTNDEWNIVRMCRVCHTTQHKLGWKKFSDTRQSVAIALEERGWRFENTFGPWKLKRD